VNRRKRARTCIRLIMLGLLNVLVYTIAYAYVGGDAWNGMTADGKYFVRGHFLRSVEGAQTEVSHGIWIYSYAHSVTIPATLGVILIAMLILARPHIIATYRDGAIGGATLVGVIGTVVVIISTTGTVAILIDFLRSW
jgi:hypothetical protein